MPIEINRFFIARRSVLAGALLLAVLGACPAGCASDGASSSPATNATPAASVAEINGISRDLGIRREDAIALLAQQDVAHQVAASLPKSLVAQTAGKWFDATTGKLTVAVTTRAAADEARAAGAEAKMVARDQAELDRLVAAVRALASSHPPGLNGYGIDVIDNRVSVTVNSTLKTAATEQFLAKVAALGSGVQVTESHVSPHQQAGTIRTGNPWWPGGESNCSVGFSATDANGAKYFLTAGHCTNNVNQAAYGQSGQQNKIGTSNVDGTHSVNAREGDMGVVAVTEGGWNLSAAVNTWGEPAITVSGSIEAIVGDAICHSGNTSHWQCGKVTYVNQTVDYGGGLVIEGLTFTTACSKGGDSGGGWLVNSKAAGLHDGGPSMCVANPDKDNQSIFQPVIEPLNKWSLALVTDAGDAEPPTPPANLASSDVTSTSVSLQWSASTDNVGVTGYDVYRGDTLATTVAETRATVKDLSADTEYAFTIKARDAAGNTSAASDPVTVRTQPGNGDRTFRNDTNFPIRDFEVTVSPITSTATGAAASQVSVTVTSNHTCIQDLNVSVVSPKGTWYRLRSYGGYPCTPFGQQTFTFKPNASEPAAGTWNLRLGDNGPDDAGTLDNWTITL